MLIIILIQDHELITPTASKHEREYEHVRRIIQILSKTRAAEAMADAACDPGQTCYGRFLVDQPQFQLLSNAIHMGNRKVT